MMDKSKPYGIVTGHPDIKYEQDGRFFTSDGSEYVKPKRKYTKHDVDSGDIKGKREREDQVRVSPVH